MAGDFSSIPGNGRIFVLLHNDQTSHPEALLPGVKQQRREADHLPPYSAEIKMVGVVSSLPCTSSWPDA
jgi:hypothetical protein